jgi:indolepyruvate ferredoxin oxidoreductase
VRKAFKVLAKLKGLRGSALDPFGYSAERRGERELITRYETDIADLLRDLKPQKLALAVEIASVPEDIRGYGHVKARHLAAAEARRAALFERWRGERVDSAAAQTAAA